MHWCIWCGLFLLASVSLSIGFGAFARVGRGPDDDCEHGCNRDYCLVCNPEARRISPEVIKRWKSV